jgi:leucyl aminopeptidase (aminopeptidase T)
MEQLLKLLKEQPKEILQWLVLELMTSDKLSFAKLAELHVKHLEQLKKGETEKLMYLRSKIICMWNDRKKNIGSHLVSLMQEAKDKGWANISQEQINNSKWNK